MAVIHLLPLFRTILQRHIDRALNEESSYQFRSTTGKNGGTYGAANGVDLQKNFFTSAEVGALFIFHTISRATARGQDNEFLLISILLFYLFTFLCKSFLLLHVL